VTFRAFQTATSFGALDKAAIADGTSLGAMQARTMARQANRLLQKRHQVLNLMWPITALTIEDYSQYHQEFIATNELVGMLPPAFVLKKPHVTTGTVYLRVRASSGAKLTVQAHTIATGDAAGATVDVTGTGSWQWATIDVSLDPGAQERLQLSLRATGTKGALMDTGTWGTPNSGTVADGDVFTVNRYEKLVGSNATWDPELAGAGHVFVLFENSARVAEQRITAVIDKGSHHELNFEFLPGDVYNRLNQVRALGTGRVTYEIRELPWLAVAQVLLVTGERSF